MRTSQKSLLLLALCLPLAVVSTAAAGADSQGWSFEPHFNLYSESSYQSRIDDFVNDTHLHLDFAQYNAMSHPILTLYAGVTLDQDSRSTPVDIYNDNLISTYPGVGVQLPFLPITVFAELWQIVSHADRAYQPNRDSQDLRLGAYLYRWQDVEPLPASNLLFNEIYAEALHSSRLEQDTFYQGWIKVGDRASLYRMFSVDGFFEFRALRDRIGYTWNNFQEWGPAVRLNFNFSNFGVGFSTYYVRGSYVDGAAPAYSQWKSLLVLSGRI